MDARAWRLDALRDKTVFEVDFPATQQYKLDRIAESTPPTDIRYVSVDFETERFSGRLRRAGFVPTEPSVWIWEGVAMYLPVVTVSDTSGQITSLAAEGSPLAMTYRVPDRLPFGTVGRAAIPALFAAAGEPLKSTLEPSELASALAADHRPRAVVASRGSEPAVKPSSVRRTTPTALKWLCQSSQRRTS